MITSSFSLTFESFARPVSFAPHPPSYEVIDLVIGMSNFLRGHTDDRLRHWIHHDRFSVTDFARIRRGLLVVDGWTIENDFSGKPSGFVREVGIDLFAGQAKVVSSNHSNLFESSQPVERVDGAVRRFEIVRCVQA